MHEAALAQAALPAPTMILGLEMRPYSIGHEIWLIRQENPLVIGGEPEPRHVREAALICCETWKGALAMRKDWLIVPKLKLWKWRTRKENLALAMADFYNYRRGGCLNFKTEPSGRPGQATRLLGAPFLIRLIQFLVSTLRKTEEEVMDYPIGLAQMHYSAWLETEGCLQVYNEHDEKRDKWIAECEAKGGPECLA